MMDAILDYAVDNSAVFSVSLVIVVIAMAASSIWIYSRLHERQLRRRGMRQTG